MIEQIPYVIGLPEEGQSRVNWIKNGEALEGASTKNGVDGPLNRGPVQVQQNVEVLDKNIKTLNSGQISADGKIKHLEDALGIIGDVDVIKQIGINTEDIKGLKTTSSDLKTSVDDHELRINFIEEDIGEFNPEKDTLYRPVRDDLFWIKTEMGQYPGQDINGQPKQGSESSGMKRRIIDTAFEVNKNTTRIKTLEDKFDDSDVGSLTIEVGNLRTELGPRSSAGLDNVYVRLNRMNNSVGGLAQNMEIVLDSIGYTDGVENLYAVVEMNRTSIVEVNRKLSDSTVGVIPRLTSVEGQIGTSSQATTINGKIKINSDDIFALRGIVGIDTSSGLRGQVAWINQVVGITQEGQPAPPTSLIGQMNTMTNMQNQMADTIQDLQVDIGNNNEGLKGQVIRLNTIVMGTKPTTGTTVEERGLLVTAKDHDAAIITLQSHVEISVPEAPINGKAYVRKDGAWVELSTLLPTP